MPPGDESFVDPYTYPGSPVLRNLFEEQDRGQLDAVEYQTTLYRRIELDDDPIQGPFDFARLKETHRRLFQDVYAWAGKPRTVEITKDRSRFLTPERISIAATSTFEWLAASELLSGSPATKVLDDETFVERASDLLEKLNYIHPFREGNGRTQRAFLDQVAGLSGRTLSWRNVSRDDHLRASVNAFRDGHGEAFRSVFEQILRPPIDGLSQLDPQAYSVNEPLISSTTEADAEQRQREFYKRFPELRDHDSPAEKESIGDEPQLS